jgi:hypothetical protein
MNNKAKTKKPTTSQMQALEDTIVCGDPWARVHGQSMHGGWYGVMAVLRRNKWIRASKDRYVITRAGQAVYDADMLRQRHGRDSSCDESEES